MTILLLLLGCSTETVSQADNTDYFPDDVDADGWTVDEGDCDDEDRNVSPGQAEVWYDGVDQNCDGNDDDQDGDGSAVAKDCDDADAAVYPKAEELCDGLDNDCNEVVDDGAEGGTISYADNDGDGYASNSAADVTFCGAKPEYGYVLVQGDCNDNNRDIAPDAPETCNGKDDNCDGEKDENAIDAIVAYRDADRDSYGLDGNFVRACDLPEGYVEDNTDCNDNEVEMNPDETERCDGLDNDCNGTVDDAPSDGVTIYADVDGDGFGDPTVSSTGCATSGSLDNTDCDDADALSYPGAPESCDGIDNDCDTEVDNDVVFQDYYTDGDGDGYGAGVLVANDCVAPAGSAANDTDCDDADAAISPAGHEVCNLVDDDCDGEIDTDAADASDFYMDADADGYGLAGDAMTLCAADGDYTAEVTGDCDDAEDSVNPGASESDNNTDDDCDDLVDEDYILEGDLVITEVSRQPWMGGTSTDTDGQWFEVYNTTSDNLYLAGWTVTRTSAVGTDTFQVDPADSVVIPAGDVAIFCATDLFDAVNDPDSTLECDYFWGDATLADTYSDTYVDNTFHLQRDEDSLSFTADTTMVDTVAWDATWPAEATRSMVLTGSQDANANDSSVNWELETTGIWWSDSTSSEYGTPGSTN